MACQNFSPLSKPLIAFDNSVKSHRAIDFIITHLNQIKHIDIVCVQTSECLVSDSDLNAVREKLQKNNIHSTLIPAKGNILEALDDIITHGFYDILFAGAYSHSQIHSVLFGSTTHNILTKTNISLFLFP